MRAIRFKVSKNLKFENDLSSYLKDSAESLFQKNKDKENKMFRKEIKKMFEDTPNIHQYIHQLLSYGLIPSQPKFGFLDKEEKTSSMHFLLVVNILTRYSEFQKKLLPENKLTLYRSQVLFAAMVAHLPQLTSPQGCINYFKKTLTGIYIPDKSRDEKEGAFYKEVQDMILKRNAEVNVIWEFILGKSLHSYSDAELNRIAHITQINESMERPADLNISDLNESHKTATFNMNKVFSQYSDDSYQKDSQSDAFTWGGPSKRNEDSTAEGITQNLTEMDSIHSKNTLKKEEQYQAPLNFKKQRNVLEVSDSIENTTSSSFIRILKLHVEVES